MAKLPVLTDEEKKKILSETERLPVSSFGIWLYETPALGVYFFSPAHFNTFARINNE